MTDSDRSRVLDFDLLLLSLPGRCCPLADFCSPLVSLDGLRWRLCFDADGLRGRLLDRPVS